MLTLIAVVAGVAVSDFLLFIGGASFAAVPGATTGGLSAAGAFAALTWTFIAVSLGAMLTGRIRRTKEAVSGFIIGELFFGAGLLHQFWQGPTWYSALAMLLVIPAALLGYWIARQLHLDLGPSAGWRNEGSSR